MKILYLNTTYSGGGAERVTRQIYDGMKKRGHEVYEIVCYNLSGEIDDPNVHVLYSNIPGKILLRLQTYNRGNYNLTIPYAISYIRRFIKKHNIELIHLNNPHDSFLGIKDISELQKLCPVVWTLHDFWALTGHCAFPFGCDDRWQDGCYQCECLGNYPRLRSDKCNWLFRKKETYIKGKKIQFTVPSDWMKEMVEKSYLASEKCEVIYNSLDTSVWKVLDKESTRETYGLHTDKFVIAFVAADLQIPQKGMRYVMELLQQLEPEKYFLLIAGKCSDDLRNLTEQFEIRTFGYIRDQKKMNEFYSMADVLVNPSVYETFGLVNIEAMASGTPVVAFDTCVMPEVVDDQAGWRVSEISSKGLVDTIEKIRYNKTELLEKTAQCHMYVEEKYNQTDMIRAYERIYKKTLENWK